LPDGMDGPVPVCVNEGKRMQILSRWGTALLSMALFVGFTGLATPVAAHQLGEGYIILQVQADKIVGHVELTLSTLNTVVPLDSDQDGKVSDAEFLEKATTAKEYIFEHVALGTDTDWYRLEQGEATVASYPLGKYALFPFTIALPDPMPQFLRLKYTILFEEDPQHRGLVMVERNSLTGEENTTEAISLVLTPEEPIQTLDLLAPIPATSILAFVKHGVWHIWIGIDHILFLVTLLLQSVLLRRENEWEASESFRPAFINVAKIVTLFTVAHSLTLSIAALDIITLPSRFVESVIAASIVAAAALNFFPRYSRYLYAFIFVFGLFHGFGFASVLGHLTTQTGALVAALVGFNVGVELGQLAIVCVCFPLLYMIRKQLFYRRWVLHLGSAVIGLIAVVWLIERSFDLESIMGF